MKKKLLIIGAILLILLGVPAFLFGTGIYVWIDSVPICHALALEEELSNYQQRYLTTTDIEKAKKMVKYKHIYSQRELDDIDSIGIYINLDANYLENKDIDLSELKYLRNLKCLSLNDDYLDDYNGILGYVKNRDTTNYNLVLQKTSLITGLDQIYKLESLEEVYLDQVKIDGKANFGKIKKLNIWYSNLDDLTWIKKSPTIEDIEITYLKGSKDFNRDFKEALPNLKSYQELKL